MKQLIENGHVYIAQPPLFKIKKGKREEYVETEERLNGILLEMGTEGVHLKILKDKKQYTDKELKALLDLLLEIEKSKNMIERN